MLILENRKADIKFNDDELAEESVRKSPSPERRPQHPSTIKWFVWNDKTAKIISEKQNRETSEYYNKEHKNKVKLNNEDGSSEYQIDLTFWDKEININGITIKPLNI